MLRMEQKYIKKALEQIIIISCILFFLNVKTKIKIVIKFIGAKTRFISKAGSFRKDFVWIALLIHKVD